MKTSSDSFTFEENEIPASQLVPHLTGDLPGGFAKAKRLAVLAGLVEEPEPPDTTELEAWFQRSCAPLIEAQRLKYLEEDAHQDAQDIENYYESRAARFRFNLQIGHLRRANNDHGVGLYEWSFGGKAYRSWLGNNPLGNPRQIAGSLSARYPGTDIVVIHEGWTTTNCGGAALVDGVAVPRYRAYITQRLARVQLTHERLFLDHGRILDREDGLRAEQDLLSENVSREAYADLIAKLCREAPTDPDYNDYRCGVWEELDDKGNIVTFETDDTRDDPNVGVILGMLNGHDPLVTTARDVNTENRIWDEDLTFDLLGADSDQDNGRDVALLLGLTTAQIEHAFLEVGEEATVSEFFSALPKKEASDRKAEALINRKPEQVLEF